jgi:hypothetical protein
MKLPQRILAGFFGFALLCLTLVATPVPSASAASNQFMDQVKDIMEEVPLSDGKFSVKTPPLEIPKRLIVEQAIVSFKPDTIKQGTIDVLKITGTDGTVAYNCVNLKVKKDTDLIKSCGGPANLVANNTVIYEASGSGFGPEKNGEFSVDLKFVEDPS